MPYEVFHAADILACENIRFSSLFAAGDVSRETSPAAKSEEKRMFSQATDIYSRKEDKNYANTSGAYELGAGVVLHKSNQIEPNQIRV